MSAQTETGEKAIRSVAVYCGSSAKCDEVFLAEAAAVGRGFAKAGIHVVYGGGAIGPMGALADASLAAGGAVTGIIPTFMVEVEWAHKGLTDLRTVQDMHERKRSIIDTSDAVVALPGGCGTLEELMEAVTWKRLGLFSGPIIILNQSGYYDSLLSMFQTCIGNRFMGPHHAAIWSVAESATEVFGLLASPPEWPDDAIKRAAV
jgi:uncharacterized protein (TIGR00730 family)